MLIFRSILNLNLPKWLVSTCPLLLISNVETDTDGNSTNLFMPVTFQSGSSDGDMVCVSATVLFDDMLEGERNFTVELVLETIGEGFSVVNSSTTVTVTDSSGMHYT